MASYDEQSEPLLTKDVKYYENCPGCKVEERKKKQKACPSKELILLALLVLCNALPISSLFPFVYFMVRDFHMGKTEDIGYYAGYIGSSFMFGRFLTSALWGMAADKYGRKPVMIIGVSSVIVFNTLFGMSTNFWMAISMRFLLGSFNGMLGPVKAYASEVCRDEHQALGLSVVGTMWGIGLIIGPALGGFLAQETLHRHPSECEEKQGDDLEFGFGHNYSKEKDGQITEKQKVHKKSLFRNWPVMSSIIVYCVFSLHEVAYSEIFSLWAESPKAYGGLGYTTTNVGTVLSITGVGVLIFQLLIFPSIANFTGAILITRIAAALTVPVLASYPFIPKLSGFLLWLAINCASLVKNVLSVTVYTGTFLLLNNSASQDQRGAANGLAMTGMSLFKTFGPAGGGSIFSWAQRHQDVSFLPGNQIVFFFLNVILFIVIAMTFEPFLPRSTNKPIQSKEQSYSEVDKEEPIVEREQHLSS